MLISTLTHTITHGSNDWIMDNGVSKHTTRYKESFFNMSEYESPQKVKRGNDYQYHTKGSVKYPYKIDSQKSLKMKDVLYVPRLRKNLFSISALKAKGIRVSFVDGQVPMCPIGNTIEDAIVIGEEDGCLYKLKG